jgi:fringe protein
MSTAERIRLPDDCTIGYIVETLLGVPLIRSGLFHSHLENLQQVPTSELHEQVCVPQGPSAPGRRRTGLWRREGGGPSY